MTTTRFLAYALCASGLVATGVVTAGCDLYGDDDCYEVCDDTPGARLPLRNPDTGQCESYGGGGGGGCYTYCEGEYNIQPAVRQGLTEPLPDWPACYSHCEGLAEGVCKDTDGCQAVFLTGDLTPASNDSYYDCWAVNDWGDTGESCAQLESWECSHRDDCSRVHFFDDAIASSESDPQVGAFESCIDETATETGCYTDADCGEGFDCTAETECLEPPGCDTGGECPAVCYGRCVPDNPWGTCFGPGALCERLPPDCPTGTVPGIKDDCYTDYCIPDDGLQCGDAGPAGQCFEEAACDMATPDCPEGTLPGVDNGCYTGFCIPTWECEAPPSCSSLTTEAKCLAVDTCVPLYEGENCSCEGDSCTCEEYIFTDCAG